MTFTNNDANVPHNFAFYTDSTAATSIFKGDIITGVKTITFAFTAPSTRGNYFFTGAMCAGDNDRNICGNLIQFLRYNFFGFVETLSIRLIVKHLFTEMTAPVFPEPPLRFAMVLHYLLWKFIEQGVPQRRGRRHHIP